MRTTLRSRSREVVIGHDAPFCIIGERINPTGRKAFQEQLRAGDLSQVEIDVQEQIAGGAHVLDVNMGVPLADEAKLLADAVRLVQSITDMPVCIDSSVVEALEADFVPVDYSDSALGITQGVELSAWGRPRAYHVFKHHPGDGIMVTTERKRVPADRMMHLAFRKRLHQVRGMSVFATIINRLEDVKGVDEDERLAARVAAAMAAVIKKGSPDGYEAPDELGADGLPVARQMQFEGGIIFDDLRPGESVETIDTKRPNNALIPFRDAQLKAIAAGAGSSYSSISKNYDGTYSAQRQELVEHYMLYQMLASPFVYRYCQPVWDGLVDASLASGALILPAGVNRETLYDCTHTGPAMPWVDPEKEVNAQILAMQWRLTSRSSVIRARGDNPDQVNREIVRDAAEMERLGIQFMDGAAALERGADEGARPRKAADALTRGPHLLNTVRPSRRA